MNIGDVFLTVRANLSQFQADLAKLNGQVSRTATEMGKTLSNVGAGLTKTGGAMTRNLTLPILAAGGAAAKFALDFDTSMRRIVGLANVPAEEIDGIRESILAMSTEIGRSPQELAEAFYFVASAGFEANEAMEVLEISARAAASGMGETQDVARVLGGVINAYGHENLTAAAAGDILTAAIRDGSAEAADFAGVIGTVAPGAANLGVSFDQVAAALAGMTNVGISADEAATSLVNIFNSLLKPTVQANKAMEGLGLSAAGLRKQLREEGLLSTLRTLEERFAGNETASAEVFGNIRALRGVSALLRLDTEQLNSIFDDTANSLGSLSDAYEDTAGPQRDIDKAMADIQVTAIELGADVLPIVVDVLKQIAGGAKELAKWWKSLDDGTKRLIVQMLAMLAVTGPLLLVLGKLTSGVGALFKAVGFLTGKKGLGALGAATKLGLWGVAIGALTLGIIEAQKAIGGFFDELEHGKKGAATIKELSDLAGSELFGQMLFRWGVSVEEFNQAVAQADGDTEAAFRAIQDNAGNVGKALVQLGLDAGGMTQHWAEAWRSASTEFETTTGGMLRRIGGQADQVGGELAAELVDGAFVVGPAAEAMVDPIQAAMDQAILDAGTSANDLIAALANELATGPEEIRDEVDALRLALENIYTTPARREDLEKQLASRVILDALESDDPLIQAQAATTVESLIAEYELIAPGALAAGELVNPAMKAGMERNYAALITYLTKTAIPGVTDPFDVADVLDEMGYGAVAAYARAIERARRAEVVAAAIATRESLRREMKVNLNFEGYGAGISFANGLYDAYWATGGIAEKAQQIRDGVGGFIRFSGSPDFTGSRLAGEGVAESYMQAMAKTIRQRVSLLQSAMGETGRALAFQSAYAGMPSMAGPTRSAAEPTAVVPSAGGGGDNYNVYLPGRTRLVTGSEIGADLRRLGEMGQLNPKPKVPND